MRLSELSTDRALDALCALTPYVSRITSDEAVVSTLGKVVDTGEELNRYGQFLILADRIGEIIPVLLSDHRGDVYGILSVMNEKSAAEIGAQPVMDTIQQIKDALCDTELQSFFRSFARRGRSEPSAPSASSPASA